MIVVVQRKDVRTHLDGQRFADLPQNLTPFGCRNTPNDFVCLSRPLESSLHFRWRSLHAIEYRVQPALRAYNPLTDLTRARTSPVVGHTLSRRSPDPAHSPSYTPGNSAPPRMSNAERTAEALEDRPRARGACRSEERARRVIMVVCRRPTSRAEGLGDCWRHDPTRGAPFYATILEARGRLSLPPCPSRRKY